MFGSFAPGARRGEYRLGDDVAVAPGDGGAIFAPDHALGLVDLIERNDQHRARVDLAQRLDTRRAAGLEGPAGPRSEYPVADRQREAGRAPRLR